jgi:hypothetical protein
MAPMQTFLTPQCNNEICSIVSQHAILSWETHTKLHAVVKQEVIGQYHVAFEQKAEDIRKIQLNCYTHGICTECNSITVDNVEMLERTIGNVPSGACAIFKFSDESRRIATNSERIYIVWNADQLILQFSCCLQDETSEVHLPRVIWNWLANSVLH